VLYSSHCGGCHSLNANGIGPAHRGVFGRRDAAFVWDARIFDAWFADPQALAPGQRMGYAVPDARDRADIIAYLRQAR
jgi:cytochrome c